MKVLIDGLIYSLKKPGGIQRYFDGFLPLLPKLDKDIEVNLLLAPKLPIPLPKIVFTPLLEPINRLIVNKYWLKTKGDIFHSTYYTRHPNPAIPQIVTVYDMIHELFPQYFKGKRHGDFRTLKKQVIEKAEAIICISENTKKDLLKYCQVDEKKVFVIYPGVDKSLFRPIKNKKQKNKFLKKYKIQKPYLLYVGPRGRYKNFLLFAEVFSKWKRNDNFDLITIGGNKFTPKEKEYFQKLKISNKIDNLGFTSDKDLVMFYNLAHVFVCPSLYEGFGIPLLEAMACGAIVSASNRASFPEIGKDCILYFNPEDKSSIIKSLNQSLIENKRLKLIKKGLKRAKDFSWEKTAEKTLRVYQRVYKNYC